MNLSTKVGAWLLTVVTVFALTTTPAHASIFDPLAAVACGGTRPNSSWTVVDANPSYLTPSFIIEDCGATLPGHHKICWQAEYVFATQHLYRVSPYTDC